MLNDLSNEESKFATKKKYVIDSQTARDKYNQNNSIKFDAESIKSSLCDYSDAFILVTGDTTLTANNDRDVAFKNFALFLHVRQKLMFLLMTLIILTCNAYVPFDWILNIEINVHTYQEVYGSLKEMKFQIIMPI